MFVFQSTYRSFDLQIDGGVIQFTNYQYTTPSESVAEKIRKHLNNSVWELVADLPKEEETPIVKSGKPTNKGVRTFRGARTSEVMEHNKEEKE
jgi:hypothetical protein